MTTDYRLQIEADRVKGLACVRCGGSTAGQSYTREADGHVAHADPLGCPAFRRMPGSIARPYDIRESNRRQAFYRRLDAEEFARDRKHEQRLRDKDRAGLG